MNQSTVSSRERKLHKALAAEQAENRRLREELFPLRVAAEFQSATLHHATGRIESLQADIDRLKAALKFEKAMDLLLYQRAAEGEMRSWEELPDDEKAARIEYASQFLSYSMPDLFKEAGK